ncbi:MAG: type IV secretion system protein [Pseudomonadota bacterium]|nr:type IV secretion system protein [Pseudomonadota bacterium]
MQFFQKKEEQLDTSEEAKKERSYLWMARVFCLICVVTFITDLILLAAVQSLLPLVRVQPFFIVTQDKDRQIITIERPSRGFLTQNTYLQQSFVRQYILARLLIGTDIDELERRWGTDGTIDWMSEQSVAEEFNRRYAVGLIKSAKEDGLTRDVNILNMHPDPRDDRQLVWLAEVRLRDMSRTTPKPLETDLQVTVVIDFGKFKNNLTWEQRLKNPLGFTVTGWAQKNLTERERMGQENEEQKN